MSPRRWDERVHDILGAIGEIHAFVGGMTFDEFKDDLKTMRAIELNFIIIGEAASAIPDDIQNKHPEIPWHLMRALRNRLVHAYFSISPRILWDTIEQDLPPVAAALEKLLQSQDQQRFS